MRLFEFREQVRDRVSDPEGVLASDRELDGWLKLAIRRVWREWNWPWTRAVATINATANDGEYDLPTDLQSIIKVLDQTSDAVLTPVYESAVTNDNPAEATGTPYNYYVQSLSQTAQTSAPRFVLGLAPVPSSAFTYKVWYKKTPAVPTADEHYSPLPEDFDEALVQWVLSRFYRKLDDLQSSADAKAEYNEEVNRLIEVYGKPQGERFHILDIDVLPD